MSIGAARQHVTVAIGHVQQGGQVAMDDTLFYIVFSIIMVSVLVLGVRNHFFRRGKQYEGRVAVMTRFWPEVGKSMGLRYLPELDKLDGRFDNRRIELRAVEERTSNRNRTAVYLTSFHVSTFFPAPLPVEVRVRPSRLSDKLGSKDHQRGDAKFDKIFQLEGEPSELDRLLTADVRRTMLRYHGSYDDFELTPSGIHCQSNKPLKDKAAIRIALVAQGRLTDTIWRSATDLMSQQHVDPHEVESV